MGYSLHQLLRYMAAHSGWHLLLPVRGGGPGIAGLCDSRRVPCGRGAGRIEDGHIAAECPAPGVAYSCGMGASAAHAITSKPARDADVMALLRGLRRHIPVAGFLLHRWPVLC